MKKIVLLAVLSAVLAGGASAEDVLAHFSRAGRAYAEDVLIENGAFRLTVGGNACVKSLVLKATGDELADAAAEIPLFSATQERFWDDELKMIHPDRRTTLRANSLRREGNRLHVGFDIVPYEAIVEVKERSGYVAFGLVDFTTNYYDHCNLHLDKPPVTEFRLLQLPVMNRTFFGDWLNVSWDDRSAVAVLATSLAEDIAHEVRPSSRILTATLAKGRRLCGGEAALVVTDGRESFLDAVDALERDYGLPRGVESRRSKHLNGSIYHPICVVSATNVEEHIAFAKKGGFRYFCLSTEAATKWDGEWEFNGDFDWLDGEYPNGERDLRDLVSRIKAAGFVPGLHFLTTHVGLKSRYVTPVADPRLNLTRHFTLAQALPADGDVDEIVVQEPTIDAPRAQGQRILKFGGELFSYESYSAERPWRFFGVKRGAHRTRAAAHARGEIGGTLDVSEFGSPTSCYLDPDTDLLDEIAAKIAKLYDCGFQFVYFDGAEGVKPPFNIHISNAQYVQWKLFKEKPLFSEGAAKSHFGWHMLSGANAYDCFTPDLYKAGTAAFPFRQASIVRQDMTRCNFGWWFPYRPKEDVKEKDASGTQPDHWEYGSALSFAWDCPTTVFGHLPSFAANPRISDTLETMRRWEEARVTQPFTAAEKESLKDVSQEHHLLRRADGSLKLIPYERIEIADPTLRVRAFVFETDGATYVVYWRELGEDAFLLGLPPDAVTLLDEFEGKELECKDLGGKVCLPSGPRRYLRSALPRGEVVKAFAGISKANGVSAGML